MIVGAAFSEDLSSHQAYVACETAVVDYRNVGICSVKRQNIIATVLAGFGGW